MNLRHEVQTNPARLLTRQGQGRRGGCVGGIDAHEWPNADVSLLQVAELSSPSGPSLQWEEGLVAFRRKADC